MSCGDVLRTWCETARKLPGCGLVLALCLVTSGHPAVAAVNARGADVNHLVVSGQSLAGGYATSSYSPLSTTQPFSNLMFNGGIYGYDYGSLRGLHEAIFETPASGLANTASQLIANDSNGLSAADHPIMVSVSGKGNTSLLDMDHYGGDPYYVFWRSMYQVWAARQAAVAEGKSYKVQGVAWFQGETDIYLGTGSWTYMTRLLKMQWDYNQYLRMFAGQWDSVPLFTYQTSSHQYFGKPADIANAQLLASEWSPEVHMVTPIYHLPYSDALHLTNHGYRWMGSYFGKVYKKVIVDGEAWKPLSPEDIYAPEPTRIVAGFHVPVPPLVLDTTMVTNPGDYGFEVIDSAGVVPLSSVVLQGSDEVVLTTQRPLQGAVQLRYAYTGNAGVLSGPQTGARGNLRDSDTTVGFAQNENDEPYPLQNWCVIFSKSVDILF